MKANVILGSISLSPINSGNAKNPESMSWSQRNAYCLSSDHNAESGFLAKPQRARLQAVIFGVALLVKGMTIPCEARLEYDSL